MELQIYFKGPLKESIGESLKINVNQPCSAKGLVDHIAGLSWGEELIEKGHIRSPYMLVINDDIIKISEKPELLIQENDIITFFVMFAGGSIDRSGKRF